MLDTEEEFDLGAYLRRIGYAGAPTASLEVLRQIIGCHTATFPFENLDPFLHRPVLLDISALEQKMVQGRRGGFCFEQNLLLAHALTAMNFEVVGLAARVMWNRPESDITPRGHMILRVNVEGRSMICDVGFGVMTLTAPLELVPDVEQTTPHETYRLSPRDGGYRLEVRLQGEWRPLYRFTLEEQFRCDYEVTNYYLSTRDGSHFRRTLMAARPGGDLRYSLSNTRLATRDAHGNAEYRELGSGDEIVEVLESMFHIHVPDRVAFQEALDREGILSPEQQGAPVA